MPLDNSDGDVDLIDLKTKVIDGENSVTVEDIKKTLEEVNKLLMENPIFSNFLNKSKDPP